MAFTKEQTEMLAEMTRRDFESNVNEKRERYSKIRQRFPLLTPFAFMAQEIDVIVRHRLNPLAYLQAVAEAHNNAIYKGYLPREQE